MAWSNCDRCGGVEYPAANPFVEYRQRRPSDQADMCCTTAGHALCMGVTDVASLPQSAESGGIATHDQWEAWIESPEARKMGFLWIT
jgi:hypothetical protein